MMPTTLYAGASVGASMKPALPLSGTPVAPIASWSNGVVNIAAAAARDTEITVSGATPLAAVESQ